MALTKILIGDDDPLVRRVISRFIGNDVKIDEASTAEELIKKSGEENYDLIITDCDYKKEKTGVDAIREIRTLGNLTPIYFHSGTLNNDFEKSAYEAGATHVKEKPLTMEQMEEFKAMIQKYKQQ